MRELVARAERDANVASECLATLFAGERVTDAQRWRYAAGAALIARGLADLTVMRKAWSK